MHIPTLSQGYSISFHASNRQSAKILVQDKSCFIYFLNLIHQFALHAVIYSDIRFEKCVEFL